MDVQKAIQYVREHADLYLVDPNKIGLMGFSAGGHLVSTICTHMNDIFIDNPKQTNLKPDFMVLIYPVVSFADSLTHQYSRERLVGPEVTPEEIQRFSNELHVSSNTPPAFVVHAVDDKEVDVRNSLYFVAALEQEKVPVQLFLYAKGGHAFGAFNKTAMIQWTEPCISWINQLQWKK
jgi:acetyl esterase/lipase